MRIVAGLIAGFGGVMFAVVAPVIVMFLLMEQPSPGDLEQRLPELVTSIGRTGRIAAAAEIIGWGIAAAAAAYTLTTRARWFLGNQACPTARVES